MKPLRLLEARLQIPDTLRQEALRQHLVGRFKEANEKNQARKDQEELRVLILHTAAAREAPLFYRFLQVGRSGVLSNV